MKTCTRCGEIKPLDAFAKNSKRKDGRQSWCRYCKSTYDKQQYHANSERRRQIKDANKRNRNRNREFVQRYLKIFGACKHCYYGDHRVLDFHHLDGSKKEFNIAHGKYYSLAKLKTEMRKCIVLCANCHRIEHAPA